MAPACPRCGSFNFTTPDDPNVTKWPFICTECNRGFEVPDDRDQDDNEGE